MKRTILLMFLVLLLMGGCKDIKNNQDLKDADPKDLPDTIAMQDDFTRDFMASAEEEEEGYYLFESKTGGYTMLYPVNSNLDDIYYQKRHDSYEALHFGESKESSDVPFYVRATYNHGEVADRLSTQFKLLSGSLDYDGEYEEIELDNKVIYFARKKYITKGGNRSSYRFFGLIKSNDPEQIVRYKYNVICFDEQKGCDYDLDAIEEEVKQLMKSIEFTTKD